MKELNYAVPKVQHQTEKMNTFLNLEIEILPFKRVFMK